MIYVVQIVALICGTVAFIALLDSIDKAAKRKSENKNNSKESK